MLNFQSVRVGDQVFELQEGWGNVECVETDSISVKFAGGGEYTYQKDGRYMLEEPVPLLYWEPPVIKEVGGPPTRMKTVSCFINLYKKGKGGTSFETMEAADKMANHDRVECREITWEVPE